MCAVRTSRESALQRSDQQFDPYASCRSLHFQLPQTTAMHCSCSQTVLIDDIRNLQIRCTTTSIYNIQLQAAFSRADEDEVKAVDVTLLHCTSAGEPCVHFVHSFVRFSKFLVVFHAG